MGSNLEKTKTDFSVLEPTKIALDYISASISKAFKKCLKPMPKINLVEWADTYRYLPDNSAEAGKWRTDRVKVAAEAMLSASDPDCQQVTVMACVQLAKTELINNLVGYYIHSEPSPIIVVMPKKEMAEGWSKERFSKMVSSTPVLKDLFSGNRRGDGNTILSKQFAGGQINVVSARNPTDLASRACRIVCCDEVDKYPQDAGNGEGDPIKIVWERSRTFGDRAKLIVCCSPTVEGISRIEAEYNLSDQRHFYQPCPHCGHAEELQWENVFMPRDEDGDYVPDKAAYVCPECDVLWDEKDRHKSINEGYWVAHNPKVKKHHGYQISAFASPFITVKGMAEKWAAAEGQPQSEKVFYNTILARTHREKGDQPNWKRLYENREDYPIASVPEGVLMITCGIDVQKDYLVYEVVGWGRGLRSWSIEKGIIEGKMEEYSTWEKLAEFMDRTYTSTGEIEMLIERCAIDSGYDTQNVYGFVRWFGSARMVAIKGEGESMKEMLGTPRPVDVTVNGERVARGVTLWKVGSAVIKEQVYRWLNLERPTDEELAGGDLFPVGFCRFPKYDEEFFKQLTAEQYISKTDNRGYVSYIWEKVRRDNHFLDCRVYARAASAMLQIDRFSDKDWINREKRIYPKIELDKPVEKPVREVSKAKKPKPKPKEEEAQVVVKRGRKRRKGNWIGRVKK
ncbi:terminase [Vibrio crassostreae 9CS106]|uniref:Terminase n=1 Tax=Vibrio crassostreae 9CS106 TaxID=1191300 RepID=A0A1B1C364_9VIBR|nr:terminase [Vibrio crassostreae 9CS106]